MKTVETITVQYNVVTPMFCGGVEPGMDFQFRLPSFKGVLRWFWRAIVYGTYQGDLSKILSQESQLFGSAKTGQSNVIMRLVGAPVEERQTIPERMQGAEYLGYGLSDHVKKMSPWKVLSVTIELRCRGLNEAELGSLLWALRAVGYLGGIGAKSRKGYGSLVLQELKRENVAESVPISFEAYAQELRRLWQWSCPDRSGSQKLPAYTALSLRSRILLLPLDREACPPLKMIDLIGREMMRYRSYGQGGVVLGVASEKNFQADHDLMKQAADLRRSHPERIAFGLPHNYGKEKELAVGPAERFDRRASPLLIHIHECETQSVAVLSFLPAVFLPADASMISVGAPKPVALTGDPQLWVPIEKFLDRLQKAFVSVRELQR